MGRGLVGKSKLVTYSLAVFSTAGEGKLDPPLIGDMGEGNADWFM
jgi:hypothetical protein